MKYRVFSAVLGAVLAAASLSACSDHNTSDYEENAPAPTEKTVSETETATEAETTEPVTKNDKKKSSSADKNSPSEEAVLNRQTILFTMDNGDYVYSAFVNETDGPKEVYVRDSRKGKAEELKLPESSLVMYSDGEKLYYYSPNEGLCEYDDGKSTLISKETKSEDEIPLRENFYFTEDKIYFAVSGGAKGRALFSGVPSLHRWTFLRGCVCKDGTENREGVSGILRPIESGRHIGK